MADAHVTLGYSAATAAADAAMRRLINAKESNRVTKQFPQWHHHHARPQVARALVVGSNAALAWSTVSALGAAGIQAHVISDWFAPRLRFSRYCRRYQRVPRASLDLQGAGLRFVQAYCEQHAIDVVIPADMRTTFGLSRLPESALPRFPVATASTLEALHDKWSLYQLLQREQLPAPRTELLSTAEPSGLTLRYPIIVKPATGEGGEGIHVCETQQQLAQLTAADALRDRTFIAQELIVGHDVDISLLAEHGRIAAYTIQQTEAPDTKRFVRDEHMLEVASAIVRASRFHGLAHFDMRVAASDGALYVIECNPRVWGSLMYSVWAGVNFIELGCQLAVGRRPPESIPPTERVWHQGVAPRRMLKALIQGRLAPAGMSGATLASWRQAHRDPWSQLIGELTEAGESALRGKLQPPAG